MILLPINKKLLRAFRPALPALLLLLPFSRVGAQEQTLVNWDQTWSWMHPMGALPVRPAGGADADFLTTWYLGQSAFLTQYDGPTFGASPKLTGATGTIASYDSGSGPGPVAYGDFQYTATPLPAGTTAEFAKVGTYLTTPLSGNRRTGYFRTTFTVPNDGRSYQNPVLRYILDDGGYVYLDGVRILAVNMTAGVADDYSIVTEGKADTESAIRTAELFHTADTFTGGNTAAGIVANARVLVPVTSLAPGEHTLAISVHNESLTSSDLGLAVQLLADASSCVIAASSTTATRGLGTDVENLTDDTMSFSVTVTGTGTLSPSGWVVSGPAGSSLIGQTGSYGSPRTFSVPVAEFLPPAGLTLEFHDATTTTSKATVTIQGPQRLGSVNAGGVSGLILNKTPWIPVWVIEEAAGTLTLHNPGVGADRVLESLPVDLSGISGEVKFTADLVVDNTSAAMEAADTFVAELVLSDGVSTSTVNLITPYDLDGSGRMNGGATAAADEFNQTHANYGTPYNYTFPLSTIIPARTTSATLILRGINDSVSETFIVKNIRMAGLTHSIEIATAGPAVLDNKSTADPSDDTFSIPVTVQPAMLPLGSTGWTSNSVPASGLYSAANPVMFGPFPLGGGPQNITLRDNPVSSVESNTITVNPPGPAKVTATLIAGSILRHPNGPGTADDTVSFEAIVSGSATGPDFSMSASAGTPVSPLGGYASKAVMFTLADVPSSGTVTVTFTDVSYSAASATISIALPLVYVIGTTDLGTPLELVTSGTPAPEWVIDSAARTLTMSAGGTGDKIVESAVLNLSTTGAVAFTAKFRAYETSAASNFEVIDRFKAELVIDGTVVNLVAPWDKGNGSFGSLGPNGLPDGYLNGYSGEGATNPLITADYNLFLDRDEFNSGTQQAEVKIDNTFDLSHTIPAEANSVQLKIYGTGISGTEFFVVSDVLFTGATNDPDSDGDGIPDSAEIAAGLNPSNPADAVLDLDGDGQSNLAEYRAGTSLTNPASRLLVTGLTRAGTSATLRWASVAGKTYAIQTAASLAGPWSTLPGTYAGAPSSAAGADFGTQAATITLPVPAAGRYFLRVIIP